MWIVSDYYKTVTEAELNVHVSNVLEYNLNKYYAYLFHYKKLKLTIAQENKN